MQLIVEVAKRQNHTWLIQSKLSEQCKGVYFRQLSFNKMKNPAFSRGGKNTDYCCTNNALPQMLSSIDGLSPDILSSQDKEALHLFDVEAFEKT